MLYCHNDPLVGITRHCNQQWEFKYTLCGLFYQPPSSGTQILILIFNHFCIPEYPVSFTVFYLLSLYRVTYLFVLMVLFHLLAWPWTLTCPNSSTVLLHQPWNSIIMACSFTWIEGVWELRNPTGSKSHLEACWSWLCWGLCTDQRNWDALVNDGIDQSFK